MIVLGIDPGVSGAFAFFDPSLPERCEAFDLPVVNSVIDGRNLVPIIRRHGPTRVVIEDVHSMPKQGVASTFKFGRAFGTVIGIVEGIGLPVIYVAPTKWKRAMGLNSEAERSRAMALNVFPQTASLFARKKDHNRGRGGASGQVRSGIAGMNAELQRQHEEHLARKARIRAGSHLRLLPKFSVGPDANAHVRVFLLSRLGKLQHDSTDVPPPSPPIRMIAAAAADAFDVPVIHIYAHRRDARASRARHIAWYLAREMTSLSMTEIGRRFDGRDHSTIIHGCQYIDRLVHADAEVAADVEAVRRMIEARL